MPEKRCKKYEIEDPLSAAKGILVGIIIAIVFWILVAFALMIIFRSW